MIYFEVDTESFRKVYESLGSTKDKSRQILRTAINNTAKQTVNMLVDEVKKKYIMQKPNSVKKSLNMEKATIGRLEATIRSNGHTNELFSFSVRPRTYNPSARPKAGHKGRVATANSAKYLSYAPGSQDKHKAFTVKFKSGHISIAQRIPGSHRGMPNKFGKRALPRPRHPFDEEAIKTLYSPSIPKLLESLWGGEIDDTAVSKHISPQVYKMLRDNVNTQIARYMKLK